MSCVECLLAGIPYTYDPTAYEEYQEEISSVKRISVQNVDRVMAYCRIPFDHVDMSEILEMFMKH